MRLVIALTMTCAVSSVEAAGLRSLKEVSEAECFGENVEEVSASSFRCGCLEVSRDDSEDGTRYDYSVCARDRDPRPDFDRVCEGVPSFPATPKTMEYLFKEGYCIGSPMDGFCTKDNHAYVAVGGEVSLRDHTPAACHRKEEEDGNGRRRLLSYNRENIEIHHESAQGQYTRSLDTQIKDMFSARVCRETTCTDCILKDTSNGKLSHTWRNNISPSEDDNWSLYFRRKDGYSSADAEMITTRGFGSRETFYMAIYSWDCSTKEAVGYGNPQALCSAFVDSWSTGISFGEGASISGGASFNSCGTLTQPSCNVNSDNEVVCALELGRGFNEQVWFYTTISVPSDTCAQYSGSCNI